MVQTYHNYITLTGGTKAQRIDATLTALSFSDTHKSNWDWFEIEVEKKDAKPSSFVFS